MLRTFPASFMSSLLQVSLTATLLLTLPACGDSSSGSKPPIVSEEPKGPVLGVWPISGSVIPDCIQDGFGHRELGGSDDFHPGLDTCDDNPLDAGDAPDPNADEWGYPVHAPLGGVVNRVRWWNPNWDDDDNGNDDDSPLPGGDNRPYEDHCEPFCRQGNFIVIEHPALRLPFGDRRVRTIYMHMAQPSPPAPADGRESAPVWQVGDVVDAGQIIGYVGRTGRNLACDPENPPDCGTAGGEFINTTHLHFGLLVDDSTDPGINADNYINPLHILPYEKAVEHVLEAKLEDDVAVLDPGECTEADGSDGSYPVLALGLTQRAPALDITRIEVKLHGSAQAPIAVDWDQRVGIGTGSGGDRDDFQQGCVAISVEEFNADDDSRQDYILAVRLGGRWNAGDEYDVTLRDVRGRTHTETLVVKAATD